MPRSKMFVSTKVGITIDPGTSSHAALLLLTEQGVEESYPAIVLIHVPTAPSLPWTVRETMKTPDLFAQALLVSG